jgi:hypothetical protein
MPILSKDNRKLFFYLISIFLACLIIIQSFFIILKLSIPLFPETITYQSVSYYLLEFEDSFLLSFSEITPFFAFLYFFSWTILPVTFFIKWIKARKEKFKDLKEKKDGLFDSTLNFLKYGLDKIFISSNGGRKIPLIIIGISILLVIIFTIYPYLPRLNPFGKSIGVDTPFYEWMLNTLNFSNNFDVFIHNLFIFRDRSLSLLLLFSLWKISWFSSQQIVSLSTIILGLALIGSTYFFSRKAGLNLLYTSLFVLFTTTSFHVITGIFGGFLANWFYLILFYGFWGFIFLSLKLSSWRFLLIGIVLNSFMLFSHAPSWGMNAGILGVLALIMFIKGVTKKEEKIRSIMLFSVLIIGFLINFLRNFVFTVGPSSVEVISVASERVIFTNLVNFWDTFNNSLLSAFGITFSNPAVFFLATVGGLFLVFNKRLISRFLTACIFASSIPLIFGDVILQTRIIYNLPVHIAAGFGLLIIFEISKKLFKNKAKTINKLVLLFVVLFNINFVFRCILYFLQINFFPFR